MEGRRRRGGGGEEGSIKASFPSNIGEIPGDPRWPRIITFWQGVAHCHDTIHWGASRSQT